MPEEIILVGEGISTPLVLGFMRKEGGSGLVNLVNARCSFSISFLLRGCRVGTRVTEILLT